MEEEKIVDNPHSVKIGINGKGIWSGECKVYAHNPEAALNKCLEIAGNIEQLIKEKNGL